jgi:hypothetical protein
MIGKDNVTTHDALARVLQLPESFAEAHIPLREHLGNGIFLLASGEFGVVYEVEGIYDELLSESELQADLSPFMKFLRQIVVGIPNYAGLRNTVVQLICSQRTLSEIPSPVRDVTTEAGAILRTEEERLFGLGLVQRRYFMTVRYTPTRKSTGSIEKARGIFDVFQPNGALRNRENDRIHHSRAEFAETLRNLEAEFGTARAIRRLSTLEILSYYEDVLHGVKAQNLIFDTDQALHEAIYTSRLKGTADGVEIEGGGKITPFVLAQLPGEYGVGLLRHFIDSLPIVIYQIV